MIVCAISTCSIAARGSELSCLQYAQDNRLFALAWSESIGAIMQTLAT